MTETQEARRIQQKHQQRLKLMAQAYDLYTQHGMTYPEIARKLEVKSSYAQKLCRDQAKALGKDPSALAEARQQQRNALRKEIYRLRTEEFLSFNAIADRLRGKVSPDSIYPHLQEYCIEHQLTLPDADEVYQSRNADRDEQIVQLRQEGKTFREIGETLGVSESWVYRVWKRKTEKDK